MKRVVIHGNIFSFSKDVRSDHTRCLAFDALLRETFGLSFETWNEAGFWTDRYQPYTLWDEGQIVANASVNVMDTAWQGVARRYIQLGTVMTAPPCRNMGLSAFLMNRIFDDWLHCCDAMYLYANDSVLDFYPKFGFVRAEEYCAEAHVKPNCVSVKKLDMTNRSDVSMLHDCYRQSNPFSELPMIDNWGLLMFHCSSFMRDCVYYAEDFHSVIIGDWEQDLLTVYDVYGAGDITLADIVGAIAEAGNTCRVRFGFALKNASESNLSLLREEDTTLFVMGGKENVFKNHKTMFPLLSHA